MRYFHSVVAVAAVLTAVSACANDPTESAGSDPRPQFAAAAAPEQVMPGEVLAKPVAGADMAAVASAHGLSVAERAYAGSFYVLRGAVGAEHANARALKADRAVVWAEPNYLRQPTESPGVDSRLWAFYNPGGLYMKFTSGRSKGQPLPSSYTSKTDADADNVWNYATNASHEVVIGSIDTGVDFNHPEFKDSVSGVSRLIAGKDWYSNDNDPTDEDGHGTHTTGTMAGTKVGIAGVSGAAQHIQVYVQRVCGRRGCPNSAIANAIRAAADYGVVAMNLSLGGSSESKAESDAIAYATSKNALVIASAGNSGANAVECPACDLNAIAVAATTWRDELAPYSNHGTGLDIAAPGGSCYSNTSAEGCIYSAYKGGGYAWLQGTSMAAPQVTGTAAVVAATSSKRGADLRAQLLNTADKITGQDFANGRLNSYRAVKNSTLDSPQ